MPRWRARTLAGRAGAMALGALVALAAGGCFLPLDSTVVSETTLGTRTAPAAASIVDRVVKQRILAPMTEEGYGKDYLLRHRYYLKRGAGEVRLQFLEIDALDVLADGAKGARRPLREIEEVRPIAGTSAWVALRVREIAADYLSLEFIVFDDALRHRKVLPDRIQRRSRSSRVLAGNIEFADGNRRVLFSTAEGPCALDTLTLTVTKPEDRR